MNRLLMFLSFIVCALALSAQQNELALFQAFDSRFNDSEGVEISEIRNKNPRAQNSNFYSIKVTDNEKVIQQLEKWVEEAEEKATSENITISAGKRKTILSFRGSKMSIGITRYLKENRMEIWISGHNINMK